MTLVVIGFAFAVSAGPQLLEHRWATATATVGFCLPGGSPATRECTVAWGTGDALRTATVDVKAADAVKGRTITVRVSGDRADTPGPIGREAAALALGAVLIAAGIVVLARSPLRPRYSVRP